MCYWVMIGLLLVWTSVGWGDASFSTGATGDVSSLSDDLGCTAGQAVRRDGTDTGWECFTPGAASGDITDVGSCATGNCGNEGGTDIFPLLHEGVANTEETTFAVTNPTADRTITFPDAGGTVMLEGATAAGGDLGGTYPNPTVTDDSHDHTDKADIAGETGYAGTQNYSGSTFVITTAAAQPATCNQGELALHEDQTAGAQLCYCENADDWKCGSIAGLEVSKNADRTIGNATSLATSLQVGSDSANVYWCIYYDAGNTRLAMTPCDGTNNKLDQALTLGVATNQLLEIIDEENSNAVMLRADPDGASPNAIWSLPTSNYQWRGQIELQASAMETDQTDCEDPVRYAPNATTVTQGILCPLGSGADTDGSIMGSVQLPESYADGTTVSFELVASLDTDSGAGTFHWIVAAKCAGPQEDESIAYGTGVGLDLVEDVADTQYDKISSGESAAVTPAGTCVAGDTLWWHWTACDTDSTTPGCTGSTAATVTDLTITKMIVWYAKDSPSN